MGERVVDHGFKRELSRKPGAERMSNCYFCGTCTASCPVAEVDAEFNPRAIMQAAILGFEDELLSSAELWKCVQCHACVAHCPQDARPADVIRALRAAAEERGRVPAGFTERVREIDERLRRERLAEVGRALALTRGEAGADGKAER